MTVWLLRIACRIPKATNTHLECAILIDFILQQWLHERPLMLGHTYLSCLVIVFFSDSVRIFDLLKLLKNSVALVRERTIPTERPPPVGEVSANFCG
jgi:hypothetical protein